MNLGVVSVWDSRVDTMRDSTEVRNSNHAKRIMHQQSARCGQHEKAQLPMIGKALVCRVIACDIE